MRKVVLAHSSESLAGAMKNLPKKVFKLSDFKWEPAADNAWDDFQSYCDTTNNMPILSCETRGISHTGEYKVLYQFTIFETPNHRFVPCHGGVKMPETHSEQDAKNILFKWFVSEQNKQYNLLLNGNG